MKTLPQAEGETRPDHNGYIRLAAELLILNTALGRGYDAGGMDEVEGWVITSAVHPETHSRIIEASNAFLASTAERDRELKVLIADVEALDKIGKKVGFIPHTAIDEPSPRLSELKEQAAQLSFPIWGEYNPSKTTLVEVLTRSRYGAVSFIDVGGNRAGMYSCGRRDFLHDVSCMSLTRSRTGDTAFVRSSSTGGASIHSLAGKATSPKFSWTICTDLRLLGSIQRMIDKKTYAAAARGRTLVLPVEPRGTPQNTWNPVQLERAFKEVYSRGEAGKKRITVLWSNNDLLQDYWHDLQREDLVGLCRMELSPAAVAAIKKNLASKELILGAAMRALITWKLLMSPKPDNDMLLLDRHDVKTLHDFLDAIIYASSGLSELDAKVERAAVARKARELAPEAIAKTRELLAKAIIESENGLVTRRQALKIPGMTVTLLDNFAQDELFLEVTGKHNIKMGTATTAYAFRQDTTMDPEECSAELEAVYKVTDYQQAGDMDTTSSAVVLLARYLQDKAQENNDNSTIGLPVVQVDTLTRKQIRLLPNAVQRLNNTPGQDVFVRGDTSLGMNAEPEHLYEGDDEEPAPLRRGVANVWFRTNPQGVSYRNWGMSKLGFPWWGEGDTPVSKGGDQ